MSDKTYKPAGYCPHCGYAIDPGVCSECGKNVNADELDSVPYWVTRRRLVKRAVLVLILLSLAVGGWYVYARTNWIIWVPTRILLGLSWDENSRGTQEVWRRFQNGGLSPAECEKMFRRALGRAELCVRSPHPRDEDITLEVWLRSSLIEQGARFMLIKEQYSVDGVNSKNALKDWRGWGRMSYVTLPALSPGTHDIRLEAQLGSPTLGPPVPGVAPIPLSLSKRVVVENRSVDSFVQPIWSEELEQQVRVRCLVSAVSDFDDSSPSIHIDLVARHLSEPIAGILWFRATGDSEYEQIVAIPGLLNGSIRGRSREERDGEKMAGTQPRYIPSDAFEPLRLTGGSVTGLRTAGNWDLTGNTTFLRVSRPETPGPIRRILNCGQTDVRFVPDARVAFHYVSPRYADVGIEWHAVPVRRVENLEWRESLTTTPEQLSVPARVFKAATSSPQP